MTWELLQRVDSDARKILDEAGWMWDQARNAFRRMQRRGEPLHDYERRTEQDVISFEELDDHGLAPQSHDLVGESQRLAGLEWLRARIDAAEPSLTR